MLETRKQCKRVCAVFSTAVFNCFQLSTLRAQGFGNSCSIIGCFLAFAFCYYYYFPFFYVVFDLFVFFLCSRWSFADVPLLIFSCPADHVPDWQPRRLLGMVEARSVNVKNTHAHTHTEAHLGIHSRTIILSHSFKLLLAASSRERIRE